ncbi:hydrolase, partial [Aspergillus arachidicola]
WIGADTFSAAVNMYLAGSSLVLLLATHALAALPAALHHNKARQATPYAVKEPPLTTPWTDKAGTNPWPEYPRPQLERSEWKNLNGIWQYQDAQSLAALDSPPFGQPLAHEVLVPSCLESGLSGIQGKDTLYSWFTTQFTVPQSFKDQNVLVNFAAVDYEATVFVNGKKAGFHRGGYFHFAFDITEFVNRDGENELLVFVHDPTDSGDDVIPIGKQRLVPAHIFYTPCSGIWQSVWIEAAPANHITRLDLDADMNGKVTVTANTATESRSPVEVKVYDGDEEVGSGQGTSDQTFDFVVDGVELWSPDSPKLYNVTVAMGDEEVHSYVGFRTIAKGKVDGVVRPLLNGKFIFMFGTLDQGYWPDGLYTPPTREAMVYDLKFLKDLGFNMVRKHIKVEPALFYRACDELGLLVLQDMPSPRPLSRPDPCATSDILPNASQQDEFSRQLEVLVNQFKSYPSIIAWIIYNEGWGQITSYYPEFELTDRVKELDPSRLVDSTSGWIDHGAGDFSDNHHYANPQCGTPFYSLSSSPHDPSRIGFQGEFGGIGHNVSIENLWNVQEAINHINETYEIDETLEAWNYRGHILLTEFEDQVRRFECSGGVWTQTTDVEGEVNGLMTYDRRVKRVDEEQWKADIQALYDAAAKRGAPSKMKL